MAIIPGTNGNDILNGTPQDDEFHRGNGFDLVYGNDGNDLMNGNDADMGADTLYGGGGSDTITGSIGGDSIDGGDGDDYLYGARIDSTPDGNDTIFGGAGDDYIQGMMGSDLLYGGTGNDRIVGDGGGATAGHADTIYGDEGNDRIWAGGGADLVYGGDDNDLVYGDAGNDTLHGDAGNDTLTGGADHDLIYGGTGDDLLLGEAGNDVVHGDAGNDLLLGGVGDDSLYGGADNDTLLGEAGNDLVDGGAGHDSLLGGAGSDTLLGGAGRDTLDGGAGADTLTGGLDADVFIADGTADTITDFNATEGIGDADSSNNDLVDLSAFYNQTRLAAWNAANPGLQFNTPLDWLRYEQSQGALASAGGLRIFSSYDPVTNGGTFVSAELLNEENTRVPCFARGTRIAVADDEVAIETLRAGDLVQTRDNGLQPIRWIGSRKLSAAELKAMPNLRPIRIAAGALGKGLPVADLLVSPQHRVLVRSNIAQKMFKTREVLVAAKQLVLLEGFDIANDLQEVEYFHMLFDRHEVVLSNGAETESLYTGAEALKAVGKAAAEEIFTLFPQLADPDHVPTPARYLPSGRQARKMGMRHLQNNRPLIAAQ
ncbi:Hint domain-containing protein [Paracoccus denitrificans]|uniref:Hint domain-containing protein n=1 Tax=Paracoccus denitrificans TaxID=266 RepID=UPI001E4AC951|nr:Hint domain-containing protein [Paracoccus denitrificans]UFS65776.1 Hint domain-containing protein [Paracoccus denitrificans]